MQCIAFSSKPRFQDHSTIRGGRGYRHATRDHIYYMLPCSVLTSPPHGMVPPDPGPRHTVTALGYARLLTFHICLLFPHLVKFLANTVQINTSCRDYDSINQHSDQSTRTTGPRGRGGQTMTMPRGGGGGGATLEHIYHNIYMHQFC